MDRQSLVVLAQTATSSAAGALTVVAALTEVTRLTLVPGAILMSLGVASVPIAVQFARRPAGRSWIHGLSLGHVVVGAIVAAGGVFFLVTCADPGGSTVSQPLPYWPIVAPGLLVVSLGLIGLVVPRARATHAPSVRIS